MLVNKKADRRTWTCPESWVQVKLCISKDAEFELGNGQFLLLLLTGKLLPQLGEVGIAVEYRCYSGHFAQHLLLFPLQHAPLGC